MDAWVWILIAVAAVVVIVLVALWFVLRRRRPTVPERFGPVPEVSPSSERGDATRSPSSTGRPAMGDDVQSRAGEAAGTTAEKGQEVADRATAEASQVTETAKDQARQVKDEVTTQARGLVDQAKTELRDQAGSQADHAAQAIRRVGDQATALADGRVDEAGAVADYVRQAGQRVGQVADHLDERGVEGVLNDVQDFARRRPGAFLLGCAAAGFVTGRLIRGGAASSGDGASDGDGFRSPQQPSMYGPPTA
jgi:uncharacterized protein YjbJ (UPF0337 family)